MSQLQVLCSLCHFIPRLSFSSTTHYERNHHKQVLSFFTLQRCKSRTIPTATQQRSIVVNYTESLNGPDLSTCCTILMHSSLLFIRRNHVSFGFHSLSLALFRWPCNVWHGDKREKHKHKTKNGNGKRESKSAKERERRAIFKPQPLICYKNKTYRWLVASTCLGIHFSLCCALCVNRRAIIFLPLFFRIFFRCCC